MTPQEERFCRTALSLGLVTEDQVEECRPGDPADGSVWDRLLDRGFLTEIQIRMLREESERPTRPASGEPEDRGQRSELVGQTIGGCLLLEKIGEGGMGTVFRARHLGLDKPVAVKVLSEGFTRDSESIGRFMREARTLAQVDHPNVVRVLHVGEEGGIHFLLMDYLEGKNLADRIGEGPLDPEEAARIGLAAAAGLDAAHRKGIAHRDLKPGNIILSEDGPAKVVDFGLARRQGGEHEITRAGEVLGSPLYMSPEQCLGGDVDERTDLYSLGVTLYHALTGEPPYPAETLYQILRQHVNAPPPDPRGKRPEVPEPLARIVMRLMAKEPDDRYPQASSVVKDLDRFLSGLPVRAGASTGRRWWLVAVPVLILALAASLQFLPKRTVDPPLPRVETRLVIDSGADVRITLLREGERVHEGGPGKIVAGPGTYLVVAEKPPFRRVEEVTVEKGRDNEIRIDPTVAAGRVRVVSDPPGALIDIDGTPRGPAPKDIDGLEFRDHRLRATLAGHVDREETFRLERCDRKEIVVKLEEMARLTLSCTAYGKRVKLEGLKITLDGRPVADPASLPLVPSERHVVRIEHPQILAVEIELTPEPGEARKREVALEANREWEGMVFVEPGTFPCGEKRELAHVGPFYIDRHEVTTADFARYLEKTGAGPPRIWPDKPDDMPVRSVTWSQASDYALAHGRRLPDQKEWEKAARGKTGRLYPWGNDWDASLANTLEAEIGGPVAVSRTGGDRSPYGCCGMAGNVREWTSTPAGPDRYVMMGGSFADNYTFSRTWSARREGAIDTGGTNGFRCAADFLKGLLKED